MELKQIEAEIEKMRAELHELAHNKDYHFTDDAVVRLSAKLDILIVQCERCKIGEK